MNNVTQVSAHDLEDKIRTEIVAQQKNQIQERHMKACTSLEKDIQFYHMRMTLEDDPAKRVVFQQKIEDLRFEMNRVKSFLETSLESQLIPSRAEQQTPFNSSSHSKNPTFARSTPRVKPVEEQPTPRNEKTGRSSMVRYVKRAKVLNGQVATKDLDDGDDDAFETRLRSLLGERATSSEAIKIDEDEDMDQEEREFLEALAGEEQKVTEAASLAMSWAQEDVELVEFEGGLKIPLPVWFQLFDYQRIAVQWMWELHCLKAGGILADEMGLGKTVEVAAYLGALHYSNLLKGGILIACPATILMQWVRELHFWAPFLRIQVLHASGSSKCSRAQILETASLSNSVVLTTYAFLRNHTDLILGVRFHYVILDEGHHIRNHESATAIACKSIPTPHRIVMTGTPIQNKLIELWSLFNFVHPPLLGELEAFLNEFDTPIRQGSFRNATPHQMSLAFEFSRQLKSIISPFILRRMKADVGLQLPKKSEQILLCKLTKRQLDMYTDYLLSPNMTWRVNYRLEQKEYSKDRMRIGKDSSHALLFQALTHLRKICNHPWIARDVHLNVESDDLDDCPNQSGKLLVVMELLETWKNEGHKAIVFSQSKCMLDIIEACIRRKGYKHIRMDGDTPISQRLHLIDMLNHDSTVNVGLMTTRVGGIGVNLVGCSRVIIFDPDWNPITDLQSRERVWRVGQKNDVVIYRLLSVGTIEEKIYQRQIYKLCAMESVLGKEDFHRVFSHEELTDLFTIGPEYHDMLNRAARYHFGAQSMFTEGDPSVPQTVKALGGEVLSSNLVTKAENLKEEENTGEDQSHELSVLRNIMDRTSMISVASHDAILQRTQTSDRVYAQESALRARKRFSGCAKPTSKPPMLPMKKE